MNNKKQLPAFLVLTIICLVAALALAGTNAVTKGPIAEHAMAAQREAFGAVMTADEYIEMTIPEGSGVSALVEAKQNGQTVGYCVAASQSGYAGPVAVTLGVGTDGKVTGAKIGDTNFAETSGFGSRWLAENQTEQFVGIDVKEGGAIEALSGATVTSTAVLNASNIALGTVADVLNIERTEPVLAFGVAEKKPVEQMALVGDIHEGAAKGFASDVKVQLTKDAAGVITGLAIESSGETPSFGTRCMEDPTFAQQFVGKTAPFAIGENIDALAGATVTSTAVVNAVNAAVEAPANPDAVPFGSGAEEEPVVETVAEALPEGAKTASAKGLLSDVKVTATFNADGTIATLTVDASGETAAIATPCTEEAFLSQFIGKKGPFESVDVVAGATFTSNAVFTAVNELFAEEEAAGNQMTAAAPGFMGVDVGVTITLNEDGTIAAITIDNSKQVPPVCDMVNTDAFLNQFIGKKGPFTADVVAGATFTSQGVIDALNSMFPAQDMSVAGEELPIADAPAAEELTASAKGLLSDVKVTVTLNADGTIATMAVDASGETAAIATPCTEEAFLSQFIGKKGPFTADVVAGATFTSNAVINAVNSLFPAEEVVETPVVEEAAPAAEELTASAKGLLSDVKVTVTLNADGTIATMAVDASGETAAIATPCTEEAFLSQFIGKKGPFTADVVAGATFTSNAVINAVNSLFPAEEVVETPVVEEAAPAAEELTASAKGLLSDVKVTVTLNADGTIATMAVDASGETAAIATPCTEEAFLSQFIGKKGPFTADVVAGATFTSNAVINAVNSLFPAEEVVETPVVEEAAPAAEELTASAKGLLSDVKVTVTLNTDGTIATMTVDASGETAAIATPCTEEAFLSQFIGKKGPFTADVVAGATFTSNAVINAVNSLFPAEEVVETPVVEEAAPAAEELTASAKGLLSDVKVTVTLNADGTIATMTVDASGETAAIATPCTEEAFLSQFIGKKGPFTADVVAGATFTSNAVINAVNSLFGE